MELWIHGPCLNSIWTVTSSEIFLTSCQMQHFQPDCVKRSYTNCLPVERQPLDPVTEHHPWCHQQLCKEQRLNAFVLVLLELNPWSGQQLNGVLCIHIFSGEKHVSHCYYLYSFHNWFGNKGEQISQLQIKMTTFKSVLPFVLCTFHSFKGAQNQMHEIHALGCHTSDRSTEVILREVKLKIELPCRCSRRVFPLFVHERET